MSERDRSLIERTDVDLHRWLREKAQSGVPELVLCGLLRAHADRMEATGYLQRTALPPDETDRGRSFD